MLITVMYAALILCGFAGCSKKEQSDGNGQTKIRVAT